MNYSIIFYIISYVLKIEGFFLIAPAMVGVIYKEQEYLSFLICALIYILVGVLTTLKRPKNQVFYAKEGFVSVALSWFVLSIFGSVPFVLNGDIPNFVDAFFETVSGFTTTGSSILSDVEALSHCSLFWRSFSHWIGGMGVLVFILSVLPLTGGSTMHLMRAESPGPQVGKVMPKIRDTATILYLIYTVMTLLQIVILCVGKMPLFDAVTLTFGSAGTGGFAIKNSGLAEYNPFCQYVIAIFMLLFGVNFNVYFLAYKRHFKQALSAEEMRWYFVIVGASVLFITYNIRSMFPTLEEAFRQSLFQVSSIITTTGFSTTDFNLWPLFSKCIIVGLMFCGACAGSTGGGIKVSRIAILIKSVKDELQGIIHPKAVRHVRFENKAIDGATLRSIFMFLGAYVLVFSGSLLLLCLDKYDFTTNFTAVAATINNIGPGLSEVGPVKNFGDYTQLSKLLLSFNMLAGRLEIFPVLVLINPKTWHRSALLRFKRKERI